MLSEIIRLDEFEADGSPARLYNETTKEYFDENIDKFPLIEKIKILALISHDEDITNIFIRLYKFGFNDGLQYAKERLDEYETQRN